MVPSRGQAKGLMGSDFKVSHAEKRRIVPLRLVTEVEIAVASVALIAFVVVTFRNPYMGAVICVVSEYLQPGKYFPALSPYRPFMVMVLILLCGWLFSLLGSKPKAFVVASQTWILLAFLFVMGLSIFSALNTRVSFEHFILHLKAFVIFFAVANLVDSVEKVKGIIYAMLGVHAYTAYSAVGGYVSTPENRDAVVGVGFFLGDANSLAVALIMMLPFAYFLMSVQKRFLARLVCGLTGILYVIGSVVTLSRGGFLCLLGTLGYCLGLGQKKLRALGITALLIICVIAVAPQEYGERMSTIETYDQDSSAMIRLEAWKAGIDMALDHPFLGVGPGNFSMAHGLIYRNDEVPGENWNFVAAHSIYFGTLGTLGFTGLLLLLSLMGSIVLTIRRARSLMAAQESDPFLIALSRALEGSMVAYMIGGMFVSIGGPYLWHIAALTVVLQNLVRQSAGSRKSEWSSWALTGNHADLRV